MTQSNLLELAKQGDPNAIAELMNRSLQSRGMHANVDRAGDRLRVTLQAEQVPNRQALIAFVQNGITTLGIESIRTVEVSGQQAGTGAIAWTQEIVLGPDATPVSSMATSTAEMPLETTAPPPPLRPSPPPVATFRPSVPVPPPMASHEPVDLYPDGDSLIADQPDYNATPVEPPVESTMPEITELGLDDEFMASLPNLEPDLETPTIGLDNDILSDLVGVSSAGEATPDATADLLVDLPNLDDSGDDFLADLSSAGELSDVDTATDDFFADLPESGETPGAAMTDDFLADLPSSESGFGDDASLSFNLESEDPFADADTATESLGDHGMDNLLEDLPGAEPWPDEAAIASDLTHDPFADLTPDASAQPLPSDEWVDTDGDDFFASLPDVGADDELGAPTTDQFELESFGGSEPLPDEGPDHLSDQDFGIEFSETDDEFSAHTTDQLDDQFDLEPFEDSETLPDEKPDHLTDQDFGIEFSAAEATPGTTDEWVDTDGDDFFASLPDVEPEQPSDTGLADFDETDLLADLPPLDSPSFDDLSSELSGADEFSALSEEQPADLGGLDESEVLADLPPLESTPDWPLDDWQTTNDVSAATPEPESDDILADLSGEENLEAELLADLPPLEPLSDTFSNEPDEADFSFLSDEAAPEPPGIGDFESTDDFDFLSDEATPESATSDSVESAFESPVPGLADLPPLGFDDLAEMGQESSLSGAAAESDDFFATLAGEGIISDVTPPATGGVEPEVLDEGLLSDLPPLEPSTDEAMGFEGLGEPESEAIADLPSLAALPDVDSISPEATVESEWFGQESGLTTELSPMVDLPPLEDETGIDQIIAPEALSQDDLNEVLSDWPDEPRTDQAELWEDDMTPLSEGDLLAELPSSEPTPEEPFGADSGADFLSDLSPLVELPSLDTEPEAEQGASFELLDERVGDRPSDALEPSMDEWLTSEQLLEEESESWREPFIEEPLSDESVAVEGGLLDDTLPPELLEDEITAEALIGDEIPPELLTDDFEETDALPYEGESFADDIIYDGMPYVGDESLNHTEPSRFEPEGTGAPDFAELDQVAEVPLTFAASETEAGNVAEPYPEEAESYPEEAEPYPPEAEPYPTEAEPYPTEAVQRSRALQVIAAEPPTREELASSAGPRGGVFYLVTSVLVGWLSLLLGYSLLTDSRPPTQPEPAPTVTPSPVAPTTEAAPSPVIDSAAPPPATEPAPAEPVLEAPPDAVPQAVPEAVPEAIPEAPVEELPPP